MRVVPGLAVLAALLALVAGCGGGGDKSSNGATTSSKAPTFSGQIAGAGATSQQAAQKVWIGAVKKQWPDVTISYAAVGSSAGRTKFAAGGVAYGATDTALAGAQLAQAQKRCGGVDRLV